MDAEEMMQDTIIKFLKSDLIDKLKQEQIESWLVKTAIRGSIDVLRKKKRSQLFQEEYKKDNCDDLDDSLDGIIETEDRSELVRKIQKGVESLPDGYRIILSLLLFEGYDYEEISQIVGVKEATVRSQYMRGKARLIQMLNETK